LIVNDIMSGAWAKGANKAVVSSAQPVGGGRTGGGGNNNNNNRRSFDTGGDGGDKGRGSGRGGRGRGRNNYDNNNGGRGGGGRGRGRNNYDGVGGRGRDNHRRSSHHKNNDNRQNNQNNNGSNHQRIVIKDVQLLEMTGIGSSPSQRAVKRISAKGFIMLRTQYLEAPVVDENEVQLFQPHPECHWIDDDRFEKINQSSMKVMELGDVSKNPNAKSKFKETAPPLEECKPLEVNEETRWKSKTMKDPLSSTNLAETESNGDNSPEEAAMKALLILNKISWTTMDRLTAKLVEQTNLVENIEIQKEIITMLIRKAQTEQHFGPMYAQLCSIISNEFKPFKKNLLHQCQGEFEIDTADKIALATKTEDGSLMDPEEVEYHSMLIRKAYIGHIKFLGELYLRDVVKLSVMTYCLDELLKDETNEESLECFAHLMSTMGEKLVGHSKKKNNKPFDWNKVIKLKNSSLISNRINFILQDLLELKDRGWVARRKIETAKSIVDLHKEVAKEEKNQRRGSAVSISNSKSNLKRSSSLAAASLAPSKDDDGFMEVSRLSMKNVGSNQNKYSSMKTATSIPSKPKEQKLRRAQSTPHEMSTSYTIGDLSLTPQNRKNIPTNTTTAPLLPSTIAPDQYQGNAHSVEKCELKMKSILKEYFVGGDTADAVLSIHELIQVGSEGSIERGAKVFEASILMVMEMKETEVKKLLTVLESCVQDSTIGKDAIVRGLNDPLEFLTNIEIDAPLAGNHLSLIIAQLIKWGILSFDVLSSAPEYFRTDGKAASFAIKILKKISSKGPSDDEVVILESLMTEKDKKAHASAIIMFNAF